MNTDSVIFVAGHRGMVGSAIVKRLRAGGFNNLILRSHFELDLTRQEAVEQFFSELRPELVILAAAKVGGILANDTHPAEFLKTNIVIETNVIDAAYRHGARKLLFLGSSCIYPKHAPQPMTEECLLTGPLEQTNEWYAIAKIAGLKLCQAYRRQYGFNAISAMPTNLYGPGDNFDLASSHVLPALIRKFHEARLKRSETVEIWGTGTPRREFLHVDDLAEAALFLIQEYDEDLWINVGCGEDITITELGELIAKIVGYRGSVRFDRSKPDGAPRKQLDITRIKTLGWRPRVSLEDGIRATYEWYMAHEVSSRT